MESSCHSFCQSVPCKKHAKLKVNSKKCVETYRGLCRYSMPYMTVSCKTFIFVIEKFRENRKRIYNFSLKSALAKFLLALNLILPVCNQTFSTWASQSAVKATEWEEELPSYTKSSMYKNREKNVFKDIPTLGRNIRDCENHFQVVQFVAALQSGIGGPMTHPSHLSREQKWI